MQITPTSEIEIKIETLRGSTFTIFENTDGSLLISAEEGQQLSVKLTEENRAVTISQKI